MILRYVVMLRVLKRHVSSIQKDRANNKNKIKDDEEDANDEELFGSVNFRSKLTPS